MKEIDIKVNFSGKIKVLIPENVPLPYKLAENILLSRILN